MSHFQARSSRRPSFEFGIRPEQIGMEHHGSFHRLFNLYPLRLFVGDFTSAAIKFFRDCAVDADEMAEGSIYILACALVARFMIAVRTLNFQKYLHQG